MVGWYVWPRSVGREVAGFLVWGEQVGASMMDCTAIES